MDGRLNIRAKTRKLTEENLNINLIYLGFGNGFLNMIPEVPVK